MEPLFDANAPLTTYEQASLTLQQTSVNAALDGNEIALWIGIGQAAASRDQHTATMRALEASIERTARP